MEDVGAAPGGSFAQRFVGRDPEALPADGKREVPALAQAHPDGLFIGTHLKQHGDCVGDGQIANPGIAEVPRRQGRDHERELRFAAPVEFEQQVAVERALGGRRVEIDLYRVGVIGETSASRSRRRFAPSGLATTRGYPFQSSPQGSAKRRGRFEAAEIGARRLPRRSQARSSPRETRRPLRRGRGNASLRGAPKPIGIQTVCPEEGQRCGARPKRGQECPTTQRLSISRQPNRRRGRQPGAADRKRRLEHRP